MAMVSDSTKVSLQRIHWGKIGWVFVKMDVKVHAFILIYFIKIH